jgi:ADP-heptose:LPS heptosyltransferase
MRQIREYRYDLAIHLLGRDSATGALLMLLSDAGTRIGFDGEHAGIFDYPVACADRPMHIVRQTSLLLAPLGISPIGEAPLREPEHLDLDIPHNALTKAAEVIPSLFAKSSPPRIILNISGSEHSKFWGQNNFTTLAARLRAHGYEPFIACAPGDRDIGKSIAMAADCELLPAGNLSEFVAMLSGGDLIVSPDTSVVHIAAALRTPVVELVTSESVAAEWYPWGTPYRLIRHNQSISMIPVEEVMNARLALLPATSVLHPTSTTA